MTATPQISIERIPQELDVVWVGDRRGTIVLDYKKNGDYEVEFMKDGKTISVETVNRKDMKMDEVSTSSGTIPIEFTQALEDWKNGDVTDL